MGSSTLSAILLELGFFSALGTPEKFGLGAEPHLVRLGTPMTYDSNNGTYVVFDEIGRPWIIQARKITPEMTVRIAQADDAMNFRHGAYVPHSNDGGYFVHTILPKLMNPQRPPLEDPE